jgi:fumarate reductase flavoprotein subunit
MAANKALAVSKGELSEEQAMDPNEEYRVTEKTDAVSGATHVSLKVENTSPTRERVPYTKNVEFDENYDVVIAGSGGAGLSAAVEAARGGLSVVIYEKAGVPGGTTNYSGGVMQAAGTNIQKEKYGIENDTAEKHAALLIRAGEGRVDEELVKDLTNHAAENLDWVSEMGLEWESLYGHSHIPYVKDEFHADRIHQYKDGGGAASGTLLSLALLNAAQEAGAKIVYDTSVVSLVQDLDTRKVHGVVIEHEGQEKIIEAKKGVVLATASVDHNPKLAQDLHPQQYHDLQHSTVLSAKTNTGDGILMGMDSGAAIAGMGGCIDFDGKTGNATNNTIPTIPLIFVNGAGERFVTEDATYAYQYRAIFQQQTQLATPTYMIFGHNSISEPGSSWTEESLADDVQKGIVKKAESLEELAEMIKVPADKFVETVNYWNKAAVEGKDPLYGRIQGIKPLEGPYYAYTNHATNLGSIGGLKINVDCQVQDNYGEVIEGLYAAGLNAGGWIGGYYPGSGTAIAGIVHQGRKAGQHLAKK